MVPGEFWAEFTPYRLFISALQAGIITLLGRAVMWLFRVQPRRELAYWGIAFLFIFAITATLAQIANPTAVGERPNLSVVIDDISTADISTKSDGEMGMVMLVATIRNRGTAATTAEGFTLSTRLKDGNTYTGIRQTIPQRTRVASPDGTEIWLSSEDALDRKATTLIPRGAHIRGRLVYLFEKLRQKDLNNQENVYTLTLSDNWGQQSVATLTGVTFGAKPEIWDFPGMRTQDEIRRQDVIPERK